MKRTLGRLGMLFSLMGFLASMMEGDFLISFLCAMAFLASLGYYYEVRDK